MNARTALDFSVKMTSLNIRPCARNWMLRILNVSHVVTVLHVTVSQ